MKKRRFLQLLSAALLEKRSDLADLIDMFLEDQDSVTEADFAGLEARFVYAEIPPEKRAGVLKLEYDTLTTELSYQTEDGSWHSCCKHVYQDTLEASPL